MGGGGAAEGTVSTKAKKQKQTWFTISFTFLNFSNPKYPVFLPPSSKRVLTALELWILSSKHLPPQRLHWGNESTSHMNVAIIQALVTHTHPILKHSPYVVLPNSSECSGHNVFLAAHPTCPHLTQQQRL